MVLPLASNRDGGVVAVQPLGGEHMVVDQGHQRRQVGGTRADPVGDGRDAQPDALKGISLTLAVQRQVLAELGWQGRRTASTASRFDPARPRAMGWKGAGGWVTVSQLRHENRSRTVWMTFHLIGSTSSAPGVSSPRFG